MSSRKKRHKGIDDAVNYLINGNILIYCVLYCLVVLNMSSVERLGMLPTDILAQPVFDRLRSILSCFIYFQVLLFWLLLYIIYQSKKNK